MFFTIPRAQIREVELVECGHGVANDALNMDDVVPVFQERSIFGVVRAVCFGRFGDFVPSVFDIS